MDDELEHSPRSWLDDFMQRFSWYHPSAQASPFLINYFLPGVSTYYCRVVYKNTKRKTTRKKL